MHMPVLKFLAWPETRLKSGLDQAQVQPTFICVSSLEETYWAMGFVVSKCGNSISNY